MTSSLVNGEDDGVVGCLTSGGTESILMAVKAYRSDSPRFYQIERERQV